MIVTVRAKTGARLDSISHNAEAGEFAVNVMARPIEGEANKAIILLLSKKLKVPKTNITLLSGAKSHIKRFKVNS